MLYIPCIGEGTPLPSPYTRPIHVAKQPFEITSHKRSHSEYQTERVNRAGNESERVATGGERGRPGAWPALCRPLPSFIEVLQGTSEPLRHSQWLVGHQAMFATQIFLFRQRCLLNLIFFGLFNIFFQFLCFAPVGVSSMGWGPGATTFFLLPLRLCFSVPNCRAGGGSSVAYDDDSSSGTAWKFIFFLRLQFAKYVVGEREDSDFRHFLASLIFRVPPVRILSRFKKPSKKQWKSRLLNWYEIGKIFKKFRNKHA